jgi:hypothetical protein
MKAAGVYPLSGRTRSAAYGFPVLLFHPLWQANFARENCHIPEIFSVLEIQGTGKIHDMDAVPSGFKMMGFLMN